MDDGVIFETMFQDLIKIKSTTIQNNDDDITFAQLQKITGKNFVVCVTNLTSRKFEYWGAFNYPNMSVITAVRASMGVPLIFTPVEWNNDWYVDGGLLNNFPIDFVDQDALGTTLAINVINGRNPMMLGSLIASMTFLDYITALVHLFMDDRRSQDNTRRCHTLLTVSVSDAADEDGILGFSLADMRFTMDVRVAQYLINHGYDVARCHDDSRKEQVDTHRALSTSSKSC